MSANNIIIDFETRSEIDLRVVGPWVYAEHPTTEIICMAFKSKDRKGLYLPPKFYNKVIKYLVKEREWLPLGVNIYKDSLPRYFDFDKCLFEAHNAEFERAIYHHICRRRWLWPEIPINKWRCSAAKAAALGLPRALADAGAARNLPIKKDMEGHKLMLKMCKPRNPRKAEKIVYILEQDPKQDKKNIAKEQLDIAASEMPALWHETPEQIIRLSQYCVGDVDSEECLSLDLRDLRPTEQKLWFIDQAINTRGVQIDIDSVKSAISLIKGYEIKACKELKDITCGVIQTPNQIEVIRTWVATKGLHLPDLQKATVEGILDSPREMHPDARRVLEIRRESGKSSLAKYPAMIASSNKDGRARGLHMFHGAHTARWTGKRIQSQNLPRPEFSNTEACVDIINTRKPEILEMLWGNPLAALASCIRSMFCSAPGKDLICADFSSVEACVIAWLAKEKYLLEAFLAGKDIYKLAAMDIYNLPYEEINKEQRQVGKVAILALGYQGGVKAFQSMAIGYGVDIPDEVAKNVITKWREANQQIVKLWYRMEHAAHAAVKYKRTQKCSLVKWGVHGDYLFCALPSGRLMAYYKPMLMKARTPWGEEKEVVSYMGVDTYTRQWKRITTYGGKLVENVVQAIARDLLAEAIIRVEEANYPVVMHVHDEIVSEIPEGFGSLKEYEHLMSVSPYWAESLPISAEGWRGKRYRK